MATSLTEKPPLYKSLPNESLKSISAPPKAGKLIRSTPVSTKRTNSSARIGSIRKPRKRAVIDPPSESESELSGNDLEHTQEQQKLINNQKNYNKPQQENIDRESRTQEQNNNVKLQQNPKQMDGVKNSLSENPKQSDNPKQKDDVKNSLNENPKQKDDVKNSLNENPKQKDDVKNSLNENPKQKDDVKNSLNENPKQKDNVKNSLSETPKQTNGVKNSQSKSSKLNSLKHANSSSLISIDEDSTKLNNCIPRRHTEVVSSFDTQNLSVHTQPTNDLFKRRNTTDASCNELFRNETKLVVLEYLSSLTPDKITARNVASRSNSRVSRSSSRVSNSNTSSNLSDLVVCPTGMSQIEYEEKSKTLPREKRKKSSHDEGVPKGKANTVTIGENERKHLMEQLAAFNAEQDRLSGKKQFMRSNSDVTEENFADVRKKLSQMKEPVKQWISSNIKREIVTFDTKAKLKTPLDKDKQTFHFKKPERPLSLSIPHREIKDFQVVSDDFTPQAYAVNRLEEMATEIMKDFPDILSQHVDALLRPLENNNIISYESFVKIAKDVYNKNLFNVSGSVWTRVALVLHTVKETIFSGNLDDTQLELLVEYSTKFVTENADEIESSMNIDEALFNATGLSYRNISSDENYISEPESQNNLTKQSDENLSYTQKIAQVVNEWTPFGIAALAVGMGLAYSYIKP